MPVLLHHIADTSLLARPESPGSPLQVICAWPVSGQYGPGSRVLYYVLVATCIFARKVDWLRNASLAGALLLPLVAALHGIVLAALHNDQAVDMDVYGVLQLCAVGALTAPVAVGTSQTYFNNPGRSTIFVWSSIVVAGLLSLCVEFYRLETIDCPGNPSNPISTNPRSFPYGSEMCNLQCDPYGPISPLRGGSADNIYVIPAPSRLKFNAALMLAAACCIPTILMCVWMWIKIRQENSAKKAESRGDQSENATEKSEHEITNRNVPSAEMEGDEISETGDSISPNASVVHNPAVVLDAPVEQNNGDSKTPDRGGTGTDILVLLFSAAILAVLFIGEWNLFSKQVSYQTEPIATIGQWQPIVGTGLLIFGSFFVLLAQAMQKERNSYEKDDSPRVKLIKTEVDGMDVHTAVLDNGDRIVTVMNTKEVDQCLDLKFERLGITSAAVENIMTGRAVPVVKAYQASVGMRSPMILRLTNVNISTHSPDLGDLRESEEPSESHAEHRENVMSPSETAQATPEILPRQPFKLFRSRIEIMQPIARLMIKFSDWMFTTKDVPSQDMHEGEAGRYPTTPGEILVNANLAETRSIYGDRRESCDSQTSRLEKQTSRPRSTTGGSNASERSSPDRNVARTRRRDTSQSQISTQNGLARRETLDVPTPASPMRNPARSSQPTEDQIYSVDGSPFTIKVSEEPT